MNNRFTVSLRRKTKYCVVLCKPNKLNTVVNVMSLAKIIFSRHINNVPVVGSLSWSYTELRRLKNTRMRVAHSLCKAKRTYNGETDNDNSSRKIISKQWTINVSPTSHIFRMRNYYAFCPHWHYQVSCSMLISQVQRMQAPLVLPPTCYKIRNCCANSWYR